MENQQTIVYKGEIFRLQSTGYYYQSDNKNQPERLLHRRIYRDHHGPIPKGMHIHHKNLDWQDNRIENLEQRNASKHSKEHMALRKKVKKLCIVCGKEYRTVVPSRRKYCSSACHQRDSYQRYKNVQEKCPECGKTFMHSKFRAQLCCSRKCANKYRGKEIQKAIVQKTGKCPQCGKEFVFSRFWTQTCCSRKCANGYRERRRNIQSNA